MRLDAGGRDVSGGSGDVFTLPLQRGADDLGLLDDLGQREVHPAAALGVQRIVGRQRRHQLLFALEQAGDQRLRASIERGLVA